MDTYIYISAKLCVEFVSHNVWLPRCTCEEVMSHVNESRHIWMWMSHVTYECEWVTSHMNVNESRHIWMWMSHVSCEWVTSHMWVSHVTHMNETRHTCEWVTSHIWTWHIWMSHAIIWHTDNSHIWMSHDSCEWVTSHTWMSHVSCACHDLTDQRGTHMYESHICMSHVSTCTRHDSYIVMSYVTHMYVTHMDESCHDLTYHWVTHRDESCLDRYATWLIQSHVMSGHMNHSNHGMTPPYVWRPTYVCVCVTYMYESCLDM